MPFQYSRVLPIPSHRVRSMLGPVSGKLRGEPRRPQVGDRVKCAVGSLKVATMSDEKLDRLAALAALLRGPEGCPWDRQQNYDSVKGLLLEEAYEVVDAVNARNFDQMREELGDVLFQVVFYAQMAQEEGRFDLGDIIEEVHQKLVRRHLHVFGDVKAGSPEEALQSWLSAKAREKKAGSGTEDTQTRSILDGISTSLPSTLEAHKLGVRAAEVGFDWQRVEDLLMKIGEELQEVWEEISRIQERPSEQQALHSGKDRLDKEVPARMGPFSPSRMEEEVGDLLFAVANLARRLGFESESVLRCANQKFKRRFQNLEAEVARQGKQVLDYSFEELDRLWNQVKAGEGT